MRVAAVVDAARNVRRPSAPASGVRTGVLLIAACVELLSGPASSPLSAQGVPAPPQGTVTITVTGEGAVTSSPKGINECRPAPSGWTAGMPNFGCSSLFDFSTTVTLTASADPGSYFAGWEPDCPGDLAGAWTPTCSFEVGSSSYALEARFNSGACAAAQVCGNQCCPYGYVCANGTCETPCGEVTCTPGTICCGGRCCNYCSAGQCCASFQSVCASGCCSADQTCVGGTPVGFPFPNKGSKCCANSDVCGDQCCSADQVCTVAASGTRGCTCKDPGQQCGDSCCPAGLICVTDVTGVRGCDPPAGNDFFVIAHMINSTEIADWAIAQGANAVEMDLRFDSAGNPTVFQHNDPDDPFSVCDCTCNCITVSCPPPCVGCAPPLICPPSCPFASTGVCSDGAGGLANCSASENAATQLAYLARTGLALIVIDSKVASGSTNLTNAGARIASLLIDSLFSNGYTGKVIVSSPSNDTISYLGAAAAAIAQLPGAAPYARQIFFGIDGERGTVSPTLQAIATLATANRVYGVGITSCLPTQYYSEVQTGLNNVKAGTVGLTYGWTIDSQTTMGKYLDMGVRALITNQPAMLVGLVRSRGRQLATPASVIPRATSNTPVN